jgi:hypothetical protein
MGVHVQGNKPKLVFASVALLVGREWNGIWFQGVLMGFCGFIFLQQQGVGGFCFKTIREINNIDLK